MDQQTTHSQSFSLSENTASIETKQQCISIPSATPLIQAIEASDDSSGSHMAEFGNSMSTVGDSGNANVLTGGKLALALLSLSIFCTIASLDTTIVGTAYIPIGSHFKGASRAEWIITSYFIALAAFQPIYGKVSDIIGRIEAITIAATVFMLGSVISAVSTSLNMLIAGRVVQGIGGAGLMNMSRIVVSDISSERNRSRYFSILTVSYGVGSAIGPVIGGLIIEYSKWQVIFWINIPICVVAATLAIIYLKLPRPDGTWQEKVRRIDFGGSFLSIVGIVLVLLALSWGGREYRWSSAAVICSFVFGLVVIVVFILYEWKVAPLPIVPIHMYKIRNVFFSSLSQIFQSAGLYGPVTFIPQWALLSRHASNITSGLYLLPFALAMIAASVVGGIVISHSGRCRELLWVGISTICVGNGLFILLNPDTSLGKIIGFVIIAGIGFGLCSQNVTLIAQASVAGQDIAAVSAMISFFNSLSGILTVSVTSNIIQNSLISSMAPVMSHFPGYIAEITHITKDPSVINSVDIPNQLNIEIQQAYSDSIRGGFIAVTALSSVSLLFSLGLKHVKLKRTRNSATDSK